ncbi:MAG: hypothetical protein KF713_07110 [Turneriella sp.]|nr:hypothetical protein [Turneriella sp.]
MKYIHPLKHQKTSVSLPRVSYRRLTAARRIFYRHGLSYSDQEIYRRLFRLFLKNWRGHGRKTNSLRRYNAAGKDYAIHPLYVNQVLYAALWQRALHSGESISRMLDLAIRVYLPRLLEELLSQPSTTRSSARNMTFWKARYALRVHQHPDFFINYECETQRNQHGNLEYIQKMRIIPKINLSVTQIWQLMHSAA